MLEAAKNYAAMTAKEHTETRYIKHPKTFLSESTPFSDYIKKHKPPVSPEDDEDPYADWRRP